MPAAEVVTIRTLRSDVALQIFRSLRRRRWSQVEAARALDVPQPTISKIMNDRVDDLSLELLIRIAVRARVPIVMQTGEAPEEAGAFASGKPGARATAATGSRLAERERKELIDAARKLTPEQRLDAMLEQTQLVMELHAAGRLAARRSGRPR